jgi:hypothetical protein
MRHSNGGLIVTGNPSAVVHRGLIIALAAQHRLSAGYSDLISYVPNFVD